MKKLNVLLITIIIGSITLLACSVEPVEITIPAGMLGLARDAGIIEIADTETTNEDGSVTYVIQKKIHSELLDGVSHTINEMVAGVFAMESMEGMEGLFEKIEFNDDYTTLTITMKDAAANQPFLSILYPAMFTALTYQQFNGVDTISVKVTAIDAVTGEVLEDTIP